MPFALLMTEVLKRAGAGDPKVLKLRDRLVRYLRVTAFRKRDVSAVPVLACNLEAMTATVRPRYSELVERVRSATP